MTVVDAYNLVKKLPKRNILTSCLDFEDKWAFSFVEKPLVKNDFIISGAFDVVYKQTGKVDKMPVIPTTISMIKKGKALDITQFK